MTLSTLQETIAADLRATPQTADRYPALAAALRRALDPTQREQLSQLVRAGPLYDGDVVSTSAGMSAGR